MLKRAVIYLARKKNPAFTLDENVNTGIVMHFLLDKTVALIRGFRISFTGRWPQLLFLGKRVVIRGKNQANFGKGVQIGNDVHIIAYGKKGLTIGDYSWIGAYSFLKVSFSFNDLGDHITIGNHVGIGEYAHLGGAGGLTIGDDCIIGPYFSCHPENHRFPDADKLTRLQGVTRKGIEIGRNCWIGAKVTILDGVTIGDNCVVAAGAVVTKDMPSNAVIGGVPAKVIRQRTQTSNTSSVKIA